MGVFSGEAKVDAPLQASQPLKSISEKGPPQKFGLKNQ